MIGLLMMLGAVTGPPPPPVNTNETVAVTNAPAPEWIEFKRFEFDIDWDTNHVCECGVTNSIAKTNQYRMVFSYTNQPYFKLGTAYETSTDLVNWTPTNFPPYWIPAKDSERYFRVKR